MRGKRTWALLAGLALVFAACSDSTPTSTLAPGTTAPLTTAPTTTAATSTTSTTTTTIPPTTTTQSPDERLAEIQALVEEAVLGRLQAIADKEPDALLHWIGSQSLYDDAIAAMDRAVYLERPSRNNFQIVVDDVYLDRADCVVTLDTVTVGDGVIEGFAGGSSTTIAIWWPAADGRLTHGAVWQDGTPQSQWMEECDIAVRGVTP